MLLYFLRLRLKACALRFGCPKYTVVSHLLLDLTDRCRPDDGSVRCPALRPSPLTEPVCRTDLGTDIIVIIHMTDTAHDLSPRDEDQIPQAFHAIWQHGQIILKPLLDLPVLRRPVIQPLTDLYLISVCPHTLKVFPDIFLILMRIFVSDLRIPLFLLQHASAHPMP